MKIECTTTFLHERDRFEAGDVRTVPDNLGALFVGLGWAKDASGDAPDGQTAKDGQTTLTIHSSNLTAGDNHG